MTTATQATNNATHQHAQPPVTTQTVRDDLRRITEADPDFVRLHAQTVRRLTASVAQLVRDLRDGRPGSEGAAQSAFIHRHMGILRAAYLAAHQEGAKDYFGAVSRQPQRWAKQVDANERKMVKHLSFYGAPSVAKMAHEAVTAWRQMPKPHVLAETERGLLFYGHQPGYDEQGHGEHGHWLPGEGGSMEAHDGTGGRVQVEKGAGGKGYHVTHTSGSGETLHDEHHPTLASVNKYAKEHAGIREKLMAAHSKGQTAAKGEGEPKAKLSKSDTEKLAALRERLDTHMGEREDLYRQQHDLLEQKADLENLRQGAAQRLEYARHGAKMDLYRQSLDQNDPEVKAYFKARTSYAKNEADKTAARAEQDRLERRMDVLSARGQQHSAEFVQAKADYAAAKAAEEKAQKAAQRLYTNSWQKGAGVYKPEFDSIAGFDYQMQHMGITFKTADIENHPLVVAARTAQTEIPRRLADINKQLATLDGSIKTANTQIKGDMTRLRALNATRGTAGEGGMSLDTLRPFNDALPLPEGHQTPNALMQQLDYRMHEPRAVTKARIIDDISTKLQGNPAWEEYVARMPTPDKLGIYHSYVHVEANAHDTKSAKLTADLIRTWGVGYNPGNPKWVALQTAVHDEFGLDAKIHGMSEAQLRAGKAFYEKNGAAYRAFTRAMYDNTQQWFADRGITEVELYRGFHWREGDPALPHDIKWGEAENQNHGITGIELNPFQSFSADINISQGTTHAGGFGGGFAEHGDYTLLIGAKVPVDRVLSTAQTGFGAKLESEVVVMGRARDTVAYRAGTRIESALQRTATEESLGRGRRAYHLDDGTTVHVSHAGGTHTVTYHDGPQDKLGGVKRGASKTYKTEKGVNKLLRTMRIANTYSTPED